ncbi:TPA: ribulose-phosphate 3-epimerase [Staphylococcus aureus]|uniref:Ribulose-phosphate 3-epimerase n=3 Tax=Staphylococcus TaxID=1279 RepID=A0A6N3EXW3_STASI|nr:MULTISPECIES: ribulose-phosphate 3-epimerase [Staphylococcus]EJD96048.1 putative ribulose-phosphate 3-epimerase [Staphylococcus epidermidis NIHLM049]EJE02651.1 putative ribulose-phosphate 3-epimerase [Staphylococcus epidermidis NIHLM037]EJX2031443.1 ribulose-phosphate 3-epimerase [Staphylococcus aureus]OFK33821.1 ribulose phosphate epimerase [Staphylococcus sp. HMSC065C10]OFM20551.1 ribulose phosphate epimerase [Staphylococcus sp. HMSC059E03]OFM58067.1 ribulose phosphate epimerase [Staphyl
MEKWLLPSMMCADFGSLSTEISNLEEAGVTGYHIDIMDGQFVPNFGMGLQDLEFIRKSTKKPIDVHLMVNNPNNHINLFANIGVDIIYIHPEADMHPARTLQKIKQKNIKAGIALNPGTSIESIKPLLNIVDYVMIMTVNPGFAGQKYLNYVDYKIDELVEMSFKSRFNYDVLVDGAISPERIDNLSTKGVKGFVLGTSSLFGKNKDYATLINNLK